MAGKDIKTHFVEFDGAFLERGFWLYIWEVTPPKGEKLYYVGRTGDSSSANAQSPFNRMGQHLGSLKNSSMLRNALERLQTPVEPKDCKFRLVAHGPDIPEAKGDMDEHRRCLAKMEPVEMALIRAMKEVAPGRVLNRKDDCGTRENRRRFDGVIQAFAKHFPELRSALPGQQGQQSQTKERR